MHLRRVLLSVLSTVLLTSGGAWAAPAQDPAPQQGDSGTAAVEDPLPNAAQVIRQALLATGELDAIQKSSARTLTGKIRLPGTEEPGTLRMIQARPDRFLQSSSFPTIGEVQIGHDGKTTWMVHPDPSIGSQVLDGIIAAQERMRNAFDFGLHTRKHIKSLQTVAKEQFDGRTCYVVKLELMPFRDGGKVLDLDATLRYRQFTEYYEVETGFLAGATVVQATPLGDRSSTTLYRDYKELAPGVKVATKLVTQVKATGGAVSEITTTIESLSLEPVPESAFALPDAIKALVQTKTPEPAPAAGDGASGGDDGEAGGGRP